MRLLKNSFFVMASQLVTIILKFLTLKVFYFFLGSELMGISVAMESIFGALSLSDFGISSAVAFQLYKPIKENDTKSILNIMYTFKCLYRLIACVIFLLSIALIPFFPFFIKNITVNRFELNIIILLFASKTMGTYFLSYNRILLYADQRAYLFSKIDAIFEILFSICQIACLMIYKNYYVYLVIDIIKMILCNLYINRVTYNLYPFLKYNAHFNKSFFFKIWKNTRDIIPIRISDYFYQTSDNVVISSVLGATPLAYLTNYKKILSASGSLFSQIFKQITPLIGNQTFETTHILKMYLRIVYIRYLVASYFIIEWIVLATPFVSFYFGPGFELNDITVFLLAAIQYGGIACIGPFYNIMEGRGIFSYLRKIESFRALINIIISITLVFSYGINGVLLGTILSDIVGFFFGTYYLIVKVLTLNKNFLRLFLYRNALYLFLLVMESAVIYFINSLFLDIDFIFLLIINIPLGFILVTIFNFLFFNKSEEFVFATKEIKNMFLKLASCVKDIYQGGANR